MGIDGPWKKGNEKVEFSDEFLILDVVNETKEEHKDKERASIEETKFKESADGEVGGQNVLYAKEEFKLTEQIVLATNPYWKTLDDK